MMAMDYSPWSKVGFRESTPIQANEWGQGRVLPRAEGPLMPVKGCWEGALPVGSIVRAIRAGVGTRCCAGGRNEVGKGCEL